MTQINPKDNPRMSTRKLGPVSNLEPPLVGRTFNPGDLRVVPDIERQKRAGRKSALSKTCLKPVTLEDPPWLNTPK